LIFDPEDGGDPLLRNIGSYTFYTTLYPKIYQVSEVPLWEPESYMSEHCFLSYIEEAMSVDIALDVVSRRCLQYFDKKTFGNVNAGIRD
jgi:hypothetical protein